MIAAKRRVLAYRGKPEYRRQDVCIGATRLQRQRAFVTRLVTGELRHRTIALCRDLVQRTDVVYHLDFRLVEIVPGVRIQPLARNAAEGVHDHWMGKADGQCALRCGVQRKRQVHLVRLQIEHRISVGGLRHRPIGHRTPWRCPLPCRCRRRSIHRWQDPSGSKAVPPAARQCAASWFGAPGRRWFRWPAAHWRSGSTRIQAATRRPRRAPGGRVWWSCVRLPVSDRTDPQSDETALQSHARRAKGGHDGRPPHTAARTQPQSGCIAPGMVRHW